MKGFIFAREKDYDEELKSRLSFRFNRTISFDLIHSYRRDRYYYEKKGIEISDPDAREHVYGMPYSEWKEKYIK